MYHIGQGVPQDYKTAVKWYILAAEQGYQRFASLEKAAHQAAANGNADAQYLLGEMYEYGRGVPQDDKTAVKWYTLAAEQVHGMAQYMLASMYEDGRGVSQDLKEADKWYNFSEKLETRQVSALEKEIERQKVLFITRFVITSVQGFDYALDYEIGGLNRYANDEYAAALRELRLLAQQGNADAQVALGVMYRIGIGVTQDYTEAAKWLRLSADQGQSDALVELGRIYIKGYGVPQDSKEAAKWFRIAAEQNNALAMFELGSLYWDGQGVPRDYDEAMQWYLRSAALGLDFEDFLKERYAQFILENSSINITKINDKSGDKNHLPYYVQSEIKLEFNIVSEHINAINENRLSYTGNIPDMSDVSAYGTK
jgi:TPR repeat protein